MNDDPSDRVPIHRPEIGDEEVSAATRVLRSGWLTTGIECKTFEQEFARYVGAQHAVAVNSCTAALHLALEATDLKRGQTVLVPTLTFAATAEVVAYFGAVPVLVDVEPHTLTIDVAAADETAEALAAGRAVAGMRSNQFERTPAHAIIPVHYAGQMANVDGIAALAKRQNLRVIEDAAHALPSLTRTAGGQWRSVGTTAEQTCFSFYSTKTITTGEGGMLVTDDAAIAERARRMSLHGLSNDAWKRHAGGGWAYEILATGFKYNLTDLAAAIGRVQLKKCDRMNEARRLVAERYRELLGSVEELELPVAHPDRSPSWHLYSLRLRLDQLTIGRDQFIEELRARGIGASVHWQPLHLHPYYRDRFGYRPEDFPVANAEWRRFVSLPIFPSLTESEVLRVANAVREVAWRFQRRRAVG